MNHKIDPDLYLDETNEIRGYELRHRNHTASQGRLPRGQRQRAKFITDLVEHAAKAPADLAQAFAPTFSPSPHERMWTFNALERFYNQKVITDVLRKDKGGKEANVYCCPADPATGFDLLAAKIYRPRMFRNLRNDARYRQGRAVRDEEGKVTRASREMRAIQNNTRFGKVLRQSSWQSNEYLLLQTLHHAGVDVPEPVASGHEAILMEYIGDSYTAAPNLNQVTLSRSEARRVFDRLVENLALMLACHCIHADLSAYNVLYWQGQATIIDFPQAVDPRHNPDGVPLFARDVLRICQYFSRYAITPDPDALTNDLWSRYQRTNALDAGFEPPEDDDDDEVDEEENEI
jgi:RIO kinase 1